MRSCVRDSLLQMLSLNYNKRTQIETLKQQIVALDYISKTNDMNLYKGELL